MPSLNSRARDGPGIARSTSTDGGLSITTTGGALAEADALRFDSRFRRSKTSVSDAGFIGVYAERKEAGFSTLTEDITDDQTLIGIEGEVEVSERLTFRGYAEPSTRTMARKSKAPRSTSSTTCPRTGRSASASSSWTRSCPAIVSRTGERTDAAVRLDVSRVCGP